MFISTAWAQAAEGGEGAGGLFGLLPFVLIFAVFYFLMIRPQQKKAKAHRESVMAVRRGDRVVTGGGVIATVTKEVDSNEIIVEIADGVRVRVRRSTLMEVMSKTEPVKAVTVDKK